MRLTDKDESLKDTVSSFPRRKSPDGSPEKGLSEFDFREENGVQGYKRVVVPNIIKPEQRSTHPKPDHRSADPKQNRSDFKPPKMDKISSILAVPWLNKQLIRPDPDVLLPKLVLESMAPEVKPRIHKPQSHTGTGLPSPKMECENSWRSAEIPGKTFPSPKTIPSSVPSSSQHYTPSTVSSSFNHKVPAPIPRGPNNSSPTVPGGRERNQETVVSTHGTSERVPSSGSGRLVPNSRSRLPNSPSSHRPLQGETLPSFKRGPAGFDPQELTSLEQGAPKKPRMSGEMLGSVLSEPVSTTSLESSSRLSRKETSTSIQAARPSFMTSLEQSSTLQKGREDSYIKEEGGSLIKNEVGPSIRDKEGSSKKEEMSSLMKECEGPSIKKEEDSSMKTSEGPFLRAVKEEAGSALTDTVESSQASKVPIYSFVQTIRQR